MLLGGDGGHAFISIPYEFFRLGDATVLGSGIRIVQ